MNKCSIEECERGVVARGLCAMHYQRARRNGPENLPSKTRPQSQTCTYGACENSSYAKNLCRLHYRRMKTGFSMDAPKRAVYRKEQTCSIEGCDREPKMRGMCYAHVSRLRRGMEMKSDLRRKATGLSLVEYMRRYTEVNIGGCHIWVGPLNEYKYGEFSHRDVGRVRAHRVAYEIANNVRIDSSTPVHHTCSNRVCVNPDHLQAVKPEENVAEMLERKAYQKRIADLEAHVAMLQRELSEVREARIYEIG